jgi:hypothetical protein
MLNHRTSWRQVETHDISILREIARTFPKFTVKKCKNQRDEPDIGKNVEGAQP